MRFSSGHYRSIALCLLSRGVSRPNARLLELSVRTLDAHSDRLLSIAWGEGDPGGPDPDEVRDAIRDVKAVLNRWDGAQ